MRPIFSAFFRFFLSFDIPFLKKKPLPYGSSPFSFFAANYCTYLFSSAFTIFWNSSFAIRRVSDRICLEHGLSIVKNPKPRSKGKFKNYGEWLGDNKPPTFQERLRAQIDAALLQKPADFAAFLLLMEAAGYEVKQGRGGSLSFRAPGQERFTRCRASTLGRAMGRRIYGP